MNKPLNEIQANIIKLIISGRTNKEIAEELSYSIEGIKRNIRICYKFYKVKNRVGLVREALSLYFSKKL